MRPLMATLALLGLAACGKPGPDARSMSHEEFAAWRQTADYAAAGGDLNRAGADGTTLLQQAVHKHQLQVARLLLEKGADINATTGWVTPLHIAVANRDLEMVGFLISHHADVSGQAVVDLVRKDEPALKAAARKTLEPVVGTEARISITMPWQEVSRMPPLWTALEWDRPDLARLLLKAGAPLKSGGLTRDLSLLHEAVDRNRTESARALVEFGADVKERAVGSLRVPGATPLHLAAGRANLELVRLLLEHGAEVNAKDNDGRTPLAYAMKGVPSGIVEEHEAAVVVRVKDGTPPAVPKEPPQPPEPDAAHKAVADYLRTRGAKD